MEGRDKGKIGTVMSTDKVRNELTVEGLNKVCWDSAFTTWSDKGCIAMAVLQCRSGMATVADTCRGT